MEICENCKKEIHVGDWPFCPHGVVLRFGHAPLEEVFDEHISDDGMRFTNWGEKLKYMDRNALVPHKFKDKAPGEVLYFDMRKG